MSELLLWKELASNIKEELKAKTSKFFSPSNYMAIIFLGDNSSSKTYVNLKKKYGEDIGLNVHIFGQYKKWDEIEYRNGEIDYDVDLYIKQQYDNIPKLMELINFLNHDKDCVGIIVQLPLPDQFMSYKSNILSAISPTKDVDGLWWILTGLSAIDLIDFEPATPKSVLHILRAYNLDDVRGKTITVIGQSNLVGKPLTLELIKKWATVYSCNKRTDIEDIKTMTKQSDIIVSCTGAVHLIGADFVRDDKTQTIIDVGYGHKDGKPVWDVDFDNVKDKVKYITPVPGGVGPLTVACLFDNVFVLQDLKEEVKKFSL